MQRRTFIKKSGVAIAGLVTIPHFSFSQDAPSGLVFDAMGEIRTIYKMAVSIKAMKNFTMIRMMLATKVIWAKTLAMKIGKKMNLLPRRQKGRERKNPLSRQWPSLLAELWLVS